MAVHRLPDGLREQDILKSELFAKFAFSDNLYSVGRPAPLPLDQLCREKAFGRDNIAVVELLLKIGDSYGFRLQSE